MREAADWQSAIPAIAPARHAVAVVFQGRRRASVAPRQPTTLAEAMGSGAAAGRPGSQGDADGGDITAVPVFSAFGRPTLQR